MKGESEDKAECKTRMKRSSERECRAAKGREPPSEEGKAAAG